MDKLLEQQFSLNSVTQFFVAGDFNLVLDPNTDSVGRTQARAVLQATTKLREMMIRYALVDTYRVLNDWGRDRPAYLRAGHDNYI